MVVGSAGQVEVGQGLIVDRKERRRRPELGAHVGDRRPIGEGQPGEPVAGEFDERADDAVGSKHLRHDEDEIRGGRAARQLPVEPHADDPRHWLVERLAKQHGLRFDAAHAVAQDAEAVDHRRVRISPHQRVRQGDPAALVGPLRDDRGEVLEVDLVDDPGPRRDDAQVAERGLCPAEQLVALAVALVLPLDVEGE